MLPAPTRQLLGVALFLTLALVQAPSAAPPGSDSVRTATTGPRERVDQSKEQLALLERLARALEAQASAQKPDEDRARERADLLAQQEMARWAQLMFYATLASVLVGAVGLFFVYRSLRATKVAADAARATAEVSERQFLATQRPKVVLRSLWADQRVWRETRRLSIQATVANSGAIEATLTRLVFGTKFTKPNRPIDVLPDYAMDALEGTLVLQSGMAHTSGPISVPANENETARVQTGAFEFYCYGKVEYRDGLGNVRTTAFRRRLALTGPPGDPATSCRFLKPETYDEAYEYED